MNNIEIITEFFGWCSVINMGMLFFSALLVVVFREWLLGIHSKMYKIDSETLSKMYIYYLALYKILIIVFCIVPYFALNLLG